MKKKIFAIFAVLAASCCALAGCSLAPNEDVPGQWDKDAYQALNEMLGHSYSAIVLTIETGFGEGEEEKLTSAYEISYGESAVSVTYAVEQFAPFDPAHPEAEGKIVKRGTATIEGESVHVEGDDIGISPKIAVLPFHFDKSYFKDADLAGIYLRAGVKDEDVGSFTGSSLSCTDMEIWAEFLDFFRTIRLTYTDGAGHPVRVEYTFSL